MWVCLSQSWPCKLVNVDIVLRIVTCCRQTVTVALQFNFHKSVQKLFHNLPIIFSNSLMGFKVICQLEKEPLKGLANVHEIFA